MSTYVKEAAVRRDLREEFRLLVERLPAGELPVMPEIVFALEFGGAVYTLSRQARTAGGGLSARERQIVVLVARGLSNKLIAVELGVSEHTVATHLRRMFGKLGVTSRAAMVAVAADAR